ncbi:MAG: DUF4395 family protein [Actinomycetota bacterium]|nr:DUF4395 family protein [Actinomycetota bacterium]
MAIVKNASTRTADPYRDSDVIDARAPRVNQAIVAFACLGALISGWWGIASVMGLQLVFGLLLGRRWCLPCLLYFEVIQPRLGEGEVEDSRPPRFANLLGAAFLSGATLFHLAGLHLLGWFLIALVGALAALAAVTGLCVGCSLYKLTARLRGIRPGGVRSIDLVEVGCASSGPLVVQFTHPLCTECQKLESRLMAEGRDIVTVDVSKRRELAHKYNISVVPAAFTVSHDGRVVSRLV